MSLNLTADGAETLTTFAGRRYVLGFSGDFGGGSLAVEWLDTDDTPAAFSFSPVTAGMSAVTEAPSTRIRLTLTGSSSPDIEAFVTLGATNGVAGSDDVTAAIEAFDSTQAALARDGLGLANASDSGRIPAGLMPSVIEGTFELADATGTTIADMQIGGINGHPSVGDGVTFEGRLLGSRIHRTTGSKTALELQSATLQKLLSIPISGESLANERSLYFEIAAALQFSAVSFPEAPTIVAALTDYTGSVAFVTASEMDHLCVVFGFGSFPVSETIFQTTGPMACDIDFVAASPPFITLDKYRLRAQAMTYRGAVLNKGAAGSSQAQSLTNLGAAGVATASKCPDLPEDCMVSFYLVIPASAAETRTLKYSLEVKANF